MRNINRNRTAMNTNTTQNRASLIHLPQLRRSSVVLLGLVPALTLSLLSLWRLQQPASNARDNSSDLAKAGVPDEAT